MTKDPRVDELVRWLELRPHPEGGSFRETFRSSAQVDTGDHRGRRTALTAIYFLLTNGEQSAWHRVSSDETWHHYEGGPLELLWLDRAKTRLTRITLAPLGEDTQPCAVVPWGCWQAARPLGAYALMGCTVGPGFDFADFALLRDLPEEAREIGARFEAYASLI